MKNKLLTVAAALLLVAIVGKFYAVPVLAQVRAALTQDVDQPARAPFQVTVPININNFVYTTVPIPAGKRLVIETISINGAADSSGPYVQPIILINSTVAGGPPALYYFGPNPSSTTPGQYYANYEPKIYSDSLRVGPAFAGYTPTFLSFNVVISGHLIAP
jgi:hypothetical protein